MKIQDHQVYYVFRCDDIKKPSNMPSDLYFSILDYDKMQAIKIHLDNININYDLVIETFCDINDQIVSNDYIVCKNHLNQ